MVNRTSCVYRRCCSKGGVCNHCPPWVLCFSCFLLFCLKKNDRIPEDIFLQIIYHTFVHLFFCTFSQWRGFTLSRVTIVLLIILVILIAILIALYFLGKRLEARQAQSDAQIQSMKQPMTLLVIDKKRLRLKEAGLPDQVIQQTPWYAKRSKVPVVKAKVGPQFINFICDEKIFDSVPVKKQVKAMVSGIYIVEVKGIRGSLQTDGEPKKKSWIEKLQEKAGAKPVK